MLSSVKRDEQTSTLKPQDLIRSSAKIGSQNILLRVPGAVPLFIYMYECLLEDTTTMELHSTSIQWKDPGYTWICSRRSPTGLHLSLHLEWKETYVLIFITKFKSNDKEIQISTSSSRNCFGTTPKIQGIHKTEPTMDLKLDLIWIIDWDEWKTAFFTTRGHYEYQIMAHGQVNVQWCSLWQAQQTVNSVPWWHIDERIQNVWNFLRLFLVNNFLKAEIYL